AMQGPGDQSVRIDSGISIPFTPDQVEQIAGRNWEARRADRPARAHPSAERSRIVLGAWSQPETIPGWGCFGGRNSGDLGNRSRRILAEADCTRLDWTPAIH